MKKLNKKIEFFVNWLFYLAVNDEKAMDRFLYYFLLKPITFFFSIFFPKRFHPSKVVKDWNERNYVSALNFFRKFLFANVIIVLSASLFTIKDLIGVSEIQIFIFSSILAFLCWFYADRLIYKNDKYLVYIRFFERKKKQRKFVFIILMILTVIIVSSPFFVYFCVCVINRT